MPAFDAAGIAVFALSYDEPDALRDFRDAHGITYTLLSDPASAVIRAFGILNTLIAEDDHPWFGIPYPGTYVLDAAGVVTHKFFDNNLAVRAGPEQLLRAALGGEVTASESGGQPASGVEVELFLDGDALASTVQRDLVARFRVPPGRHAYAEPAPAGTVAASLAVDDDPRLVQRPLLRPESEPHCLAGTGERFPVHNGTFELRLPLTVNRGASGDDDTLTVTGELRWQSCDDEVCDIPVRRRFELALPLTSTPPVALGSERGAALEPNAMAHFQRMTTRRG